MAAGHDASTTAGRARILLVDDRAENLLALEAILSSLDQVLVRAGSGEEALKALLVEEFAVILLDVQMPGMDGFETAAHIKRRERTRDIPIIFLTAINREPQHAFRGYNAGAVDYLAKPFDPWVLRAKVAVFVELHLKNRQLHEQTELLRQRLAVSAEANVSAAQASPQDAAAVGGLWEALADVEVQVELLVAQTSDTTDAGLADCVAGLEKGVSRLRAAVQLLQAPPPALPG